MFLPLSTPYSMTVVSAGGMTEPKQLALHPAELLHFVVVAVPQVKPQARSRAGFRLPRVEEAEIQVAHLLM